jgi:hypothetical protein
VVAGKSLVGDPHRQVGPAVSASTSGLLDLLQVPVTGAGRMIDPLPQPTGGSHYGAYGVLRLQGRRHLSSSTSVGSWGHAWPHPSGTVRALAVV